VHFRSGGIIHDQADHASYERCQKSLRVLKEEMMGGPLRTLSVALLDPQRARRTALEGQLVQLGHQTIVFATPAEFLTMLCVGHRFDLLLFTLYDPAIHEIVSKVCKRLHIPVLLVMQDEHWELLLPRGKEDEWHDFIDLDVVQPKLQELDWRIQALLKRGNTTFEVPRITSEKTWGDYTFMPDSTTVVHRGRRIRLSRLEFAFAFELFRNASRVLTRDWLLHTVWANRPRADDTRTVDVCATKVRKKLGLTFENGFVLRAIHRQGYQLISVLRDGCAMERVVSQILPSQDLRQDWMAKTRRASSQEELAG
jgi:DNA-binding response OmpR family regulator